MSHDSARQVAIEAKYLRPRLDDVSLRPGALDALGPAFARRLTVICAPAGYGKTTTTAAALESCGYTSSWYKLDILDHDPLAFLAAMTRAVQRLYTGFGEALLQALEAGPLSDVPVEVLAAQFCSQCDRFVTADLHLVLDDYHEAMDSSALNAVLDYLFENCPSLVHFVVLTRYEPAFRLEKLRLAGAVARVPRDLFLFDPDQVADILAQRSGHRHDPEHVLRLHRLTEGWPASVVLAGMALAWLDASSLEVALADPRLRTDVFSYLAEQVFQRQSEDVRRFLLGTCCLEHVTVGLAEKLTGSDRASRHLHFLAHNHIFTFDTERAGAYRYHNLLRDFLRQRFVHDEGEAAFRALQRRTAVALEESGDLPGAVELLLSANELDLALAAVARGGEAELERRPSEQLRIWTAKLSTHTEAGEPWALVISGVLHAREGFFEAALAELRSATEQLRGGPDANHLYEVLSVTEWAEFWAGDSVASMQTCHRALEAAQSDKQRLHTLLSLASAALDMRQWDVAEGAFGKAERLLKRAPRPEAARARALQAHAAFYRGDVRSARKLMSEVPISEATIAQKAASLNTLGMIDFALANYASAGEHFREALEIAEGFGRSLTSHVEDNMALLTSATGKHEQALAELEWILDHSDALDPTMICSAVMHRGTVLRRCGELQRSADATRLALEIVSTERDPYLALNAQANLALAEGMMGRHCLKALARIQADATVAGVSFVRLKARMFGAFLIDQDGDHRLAAETLEACLDEQLKLGHVNLIAQELSLRPQLTSLVLARHRRNGLGPMLIESISRHWQFEEVAQTLREFGAPRIESWISSISEDQTDLRTKTRKEYRDAAGSSTKVFRGSDLTSREIQVLSLMARNLSNDDIARELFIALSTVKTHVNHILRKLGQTTRVGAILEYQRLVESSPPGPRAEINPRYDSSDTPRN